MLYHRALESVAAVIDPLLRQQFPHHEVVYIGNGNAGTTYRHHQTAAVVRQLSRREGVVPVHFTGSAEEAGGIVRESTGGKRIIVTLGGDGTHNHCLSAGIGLADPPLFLRVPLGSGNDTGPFHDLGQFLEALQQKLTERWIPALQVSTATNGNAAAAFNIASIGIDAFVTVMHDRWRRLLPGNTYRILADLAVLRYEKIVNVAPCGLQIENESGAVEDVGTAIRMLIAMGVSGQRTYGDHMNVLPGVENLCVLGYATLRDKLRIKSLFYSGLHVHEPITSMYSARAVTVHYDRRVPLQVDGEALWLQRDDFPVRFELLERAVAVIDPPGPQEKL